MIRSSRGPNHRYTHRKSGSVCLKCGTRMRRKTLASKPEYAAPRSRWWSTLNPGCPAQFRSLDGFHRWYNRTFLSRRSR